jgi:hypothetical protein|tara:strand:+ start:972 stop:1283 length:312 start_codon:yes stop_codon:yes gene_type:complete
VCGFLLNGGDNPAEDEKNEDWLDYEKLLINVNRNSSTGKHYAIFHDKEILDKNDGKPREIYIDNLEKELKDMREEQLYTYFVSMIDLISLMCLSRNMSGISLL